MNLRRHVALFSLAISGVVACGDGGSSVGPDAASVDATPDPDLPYDRPSDFDRSNCQPGSLAGLADTLGVYHFQLDLEGYFANVPVRINAVGGDGVGDGLFNGREPVQRVISTDDDLLIHSVGDSGLRSLDLCSRDADGTLHGIYARCPSDECFEFAVVGQKIDRLPEAEAGGLTLLGEYFGAGWDEGLPVNVRVVDSVAYLANYWDGLRILDVSNPAAPTELGHIATEFGGSEIYNDVKIVDGPGNRRYALMASSAAAMVVVDVTNPSEPSIVAHGGATNADVHAIFVDGTIAYLANLDYGLEIWSVANPAVPVKLGQFTRGGAFLHDLYIDGNRAYLNWWDGGMAIVDVSNPVAPMELGVFDNYGEDTSHSNWVTTVGDRRISVHGDEQYGAHVRLVDVTEGTAEFTTPVGEWKTRDGVSAHNIMAFGDRAYVAYYQDGVRVLDISDPENPEQIAWFNTWSPSEPNTGLGFFEGAIGIDVDLAAGLVYVADSQRGLMILAIDP